MNGRIRRLAIVLLGLYVLLFVQLNVLQVYRQHSLETHPLNNRQSIRDFNRPRGPIITADGVVVAASVPSPPGDEFTYQRTYPLGDLFSNVTGYYTYGFGSTQLEKTENDVLAGRTAAQLIDGVLGGADNTGSVRLTLDAGLQRVAADALGDREGSVVVLEPGTGKVLAMVSYPRFDANQVATHDTDVAEDVFAYLNNYPGKPLLANAYQENYMPGSAFKIITTAIALERNVIDLEREWAVEKEWLPPQTLDPVQNYGGKECGGQLTEVFFRSCNIPFAQLAIEMGADAMVNGTRVWGFGEPIPIDLPRPAASNFEYAGRDLIDFAQNLPLLAIAGFGQANDKVTPLHMAMVAATVANGGRMMKPYVVDATLTHSGRIIDRTEPSVWKTPITAATAATLTQLMVEVVNRGTGQPMQLRGGVQAAAKTGTAQLNATGEEQRSHAWITAFAPAEAPRYAIAVILKGTNDEISAGTGGRLAGPVAKTVLDFLFARG